MYAIIFEDASLRFTVPGTSPDAPTTPSSPFTYGNALKEV